MEIKKTYIFLSTDPMVDGVIPIKVHHCRYNSSSLTSPVKNFYFKEGNNGTLTQIYQNDFNILEANSNQIVKEL